MSCEPVIDIRRVTEADLERQRANGWPDFHPEDYCHRCGGRNCVWWVDSDEWNRVMRDEDGNQLWWGIVCPSCFCELAGKPLIEVRVVRS